MKVMTRRSSGPVMICCFALRPWASIGHKSLNERMGRNVRKAVMDSKAREREAREGMSCARKQSHNGQFLAGGGREDWWGRGRGALTLGAHCIVE